MNHPDRLPLLAADVAAPAHVRHPRLLAWVARHRGARRSPSAIVWCDGSEAEYDRALRRDGRSGHAAAGSIRRCGRTATSRARIRPTSRASRIARSSAASAKDDAGPTNNWVAPAEMRKTLRRSVRRLHARTHDVRRAVLDGTARQPHRAYRRRAHRQPVRRRQHEADDADGTRGLRRSRQRRRVRAVRAFGRRAARAGASRTSRWPCNPEHKYIVHFPETREIWSYGSGYGGNALLGKKCFALRIASVMGRDEGWLAEHMLILGVTSPAGEKTYVTAAFPSACGKTNFAMLIPPKGFDGWKVTTIGDDIAWIKPHADGRFYAINPEAGYFGVAPGTSYESNPNAMEMLKANVIFTNVALTDDGDVWWEGMTKRAARASDRLARQAVDARTAGARPRIPMRVSPFAATQCPSLDPDWDNPERRADLRVHLRRAAQRHRAAGGRGARPGRKASTRRRRWAPRRPPRPPARWAKCAAIRSRCCRSAAITSAITSRTGWRWATTVAKPPRIFNVNWFRTDANGKFVWPGFGQNMRVLKWIVERCHGRGACGARRRSGCEPAYDDLNWRGLEFATRTLRDRSCASTSRVGEASSRRTTSFSPSSARSSHRFWRRKRRRLGARLGR